MANTQVQRDRFAEALLKSLVDFLQADLAAAWGGAVEAVLGSPDLDYDNRMKSNGLTERRDLALKPFLVLVVIDSASGSWAMSPAGDEMERSALVRIEAMAKDNSDLLSLLPTIESVFEGAATSTGGISFRDPDTHVELGVIYPDPDTMIHSTFAGPGDESSAQRGGAGSSMPKSVEQYDNLKHRGYVLISFTRAKVRGSKVI